MLGPGTSSEAQREGSNAANVWSRDEPDPQDIRPMPTSPAGGGAAKHRNRRSTKKEAKALARQTQAQAAEAQPQQGQTAPQEEMPDQSLARQEQDAPQHEESQAEARDLQQGPPQVQRRAATTRVTFPTPDWDEIKDRTQTRTRSQTQETTSTTVRDPGTEEEETFATPMAAAPSSRTRGAAGPTGGYKDPSTSTSS